jgi:hypothetical protein
VSWRGNTYSVPPGHAGQQLRVSHRLGATVLSIATQAGVTIAVHSIRSDGAGVTVRADHHVTALNTAAMAAFTTTAPHRSKQRIPPGPLRSQPRTCCAATSLTPPRLPLGRRW